MDKDLYFRAFGLKSGISGRYQWTFLAALLYLAAIGIASIVENSNSYRAEEGWVIALDGSESMGDTLDVGLTKFDRAKRIAKDIIAEAHPRPVAILLYSADSYLLAPFSTDYDDLLADLNVLSLDMTPISGTRPDKAIAAALPLAKQAGLNRERIILIADGVGNAQETVNPDVNVEMVLIEPQLNAQQQSWIDRLHINVVDSSLTQTQLLPSLKRGLNVGSAWLGARERVVDKSHYIILVALAFLAWILLRES